MIADANRYEPRSNDTVLDFARHYGAWLLSALPRHPQDKAKAETAVQNVERWIMARLRHQQFDSVHEVDLAMAPLLTRLNEKLFQKLQRVPACRKSCESGTAAGAFGKWLLQLAKTDVVVLDDWGMGAIDSMTRSDLLAIIDGRTGSKATIITSQLPVEHWHAWVGDATIDAILDRIMQRNHRVTLTGDSLRAQRPKTCKKEKNVAPS